MAGVQTGIYYFGTISLDQDYTPSEKMVNHLKNKFKDYLYAVIEHGEQGGKQHLHWIGLSTVRGDNLKQSIKKVLEKDGYSLSQYSVDLSPEPNPVWRLGYLLKEETRVKVAELNVPTHFFEEAKKQYEAKPKRSRPQKDAKSISQKAIAEYMMENNCQTKDDISRCLDILIDEGRLDFPTYSKLNRKNLLDFITRIHYL